MAVEQSTSTEAVVEQAAADVEANAGTPSEALQDNSIESFLALAASAMDQEAPAPEQEGEEPVVESAADEALGEANDIEAVGQEDESEPEAEPNQAASPRAQERIRKLASEKAEAVQRAEALRTEFQGYAQQLQAQNQQLVGLVQNLAGQVEVLKQPKGPKTYETPFDELVDKTRGQITPEVQAIVNQQLQQALGPVAHELQKLRAESAERTKADQGEKYRATQQAQLDQAITSIFKGKTLSKATRLTAEQTLLGVALARNADVKDVVSEARELFQELRGVELTERKAKGSTIKGKNAGVPPVTRVSIKARGESKPNFTRDQIREAGYETTGAAMRDGYRRLTKRAGAR